MSDNKKEQKSRNAVSLKEKLSIYEYKEQNPGESFRTISELF